ncbi:MAG TPA: hypothetical protein ENI94_02455 [Gammaproteobacteria bacterium]|nr:hypothetical protein [Gammaproteobacteria bacterium]
MVPAEHIARLLEEIIETGRRQGMTQAEIAHTAGLASDTLSRAKRNPNVGLENFAKLAQAVGLKPVLVPDDPVIEKIERGGLFSR